MISTGHKAGDNSADQANRKTNIIISEPQPLQNQSPYDESLRPADDRKRSEKNKFINKLKQFHGSNSSQMKTVPMTMPPLSASNPSGPGDKKERNKMAARQSRDRKKLYVQLMETKIEQLENELQDTAKAIEQVRLNIFSAEMKQGAKGQEANHRQMHIIKKIEGLLEDANLDDRNNQINICLDSIIYRIGALGRQRKSALSKLYFDLLNHSQPALYRYMLWSAVHKKHLFGAADLPEKQKWYKENEPIAHQIVVVSNSKGPQLEKLGSKIAGHCSHFQKSAEDLVKFRAVIEKKGHYLDNIFNEIREVLTPQQVANLILFVEKYQFKKQIRLFEEENNLEEISRPRKKVKRDQQI